ncbi:MAG: hypothetical protein DI563_20440 [Variovorax paradoxus]|uniref:Lipoprotein n=1 Tax=Variovorax paradoxus TaxID=34073 RepID=A0A2W5PR69_VARPD|nr:MAG: hypothetical protein DI563_20440 [Variovorax paradoxus]
MRRRASLLLPLAAAALAGCASVSGFDIGARTLHYVSPLGALAPGQWIHADCRTRADQNAAVFKDWVLVHHRIAVRYWIVPTAGAAPPQSVQVDEHACARVVPPVS